MNVLLATFPQLFEIYIEDFISLLEFFPIITVLWVRIFLVYMRSHKG
jgi:hypothetical protein